MNVSKQPAARGHHKHPAARGHHKHPAARGHHIQQPAARGLYLLAALTTVVVVATATTTSGKAAAAATLAPRSATAATASRSVGAAVTRSPERIAGEALGGADAWGATLAQAGTYTMYVCAESDDVVEKLAFSNGDFQRIRSIPVGAWPTEIEGPHGIAISPDGRYWYVSMAHGQPGPFGSLYKFDTETDMPLGEVELGMFPATMAISPSIGLVYVVNFNLHGLPEPSTISVVDPESMSEVGRIDVGIMPHGARVNRQGTRLYSVNMMDDTLTEVDTYRMEVTRMLALSPHGEHTLAAMHEGMRGGGQGTGGMDMTAMVKPTWATPPTAQGRIYVAGNGAAKIFEVDVEAWKVTGTFPTPAGPYNIDVSADGTLLAVSYKSSASVGFWNLETGEEVGRIETLRPIPHGVVITRDARYAFATMEGIGGEPGSVEAYDLSTFTRVANIDIAKQAGGIALWRQ